MGWKGASRLAAHLEGRNKRQLAKSLNMDPSTLSNYLSGRRSPDPDTLARICEALGVSADELLGLAPARERPQPPQPEPVRSGRVPMAQVRDALLQLIARFDRRSLEASDSERLDRLEAEIRELRAELLTKEAIR